MNNQGSTRKFNIGIAILKVAACFGVISMHFGAYGFFRKPAVPTFVFVSFYLSSKLFDQFRFGDLWSRIVRLAIPFFLWGIISLLCWWLCGYSVSGKMVLMQLTCGRTDVVSAGHLYYLEVCIIITLILFALPRKWFDFWLVAVVAASFCWQYSGWNYKVFHPMGYNIMNTFGRVSEFITYAAAGLLLSRMIRKIHGAFGSKWFWIGSVIAFVLAGVIYVCKLIPTPLGFASQGVAAFLLTVSLDVPLIALGEWLTRSAYPLYGVLTGLLKYVSSLTSGIYYIHVLVGTVLVALFDLEHSFLLTILVFLTCVPVTIVLGKVKWTRLLVK